MTYRRFKGGAFGSLSIQQGAHVDTTLALITSLATMALAVAEAESAQARPPAVAPSTPASDSELPSSDPDPAEGSRWIGCDCDSVFVATTIEVVWRQEAEALQRDAEACREGIRKTLEEIAAWLEDAGRLRPAMPREKSDAIMQSLMQGSQGIAQGIQGVGQALVELSTGLEAPHSTFPDPIREVLQGLARRDRAALRASMTSTVLEPSGSGRVVGSAQPQRVTSVKEATVAMERSSVELGAREQVLDRLVAELTAISVQGADLWGWSQAVGIERIPSISGSGDVEPIESTSERRQWELESALRYTCAMETYIRQVPEWFARTGVGDPWMALVETALPSPLASKRRGFPDLRATFLDRLGSAGALRAETQIRTIQGNARKRVGRWLETQIQGIGAVDDPALSARWTCLSEFAGLLQEGKPLPKAAVEEPREDVAP